MSQANGLVTAGKLVLTDTFRNDDVFSRFRVSTPQNVFNISHRNSIEIQNSLDTVSTGSGSTVVDSDKSCSILSTTSTGGRIVMQSFEYPEYIPGYSRLIYITGCLNPGGVSTNGMVARMGIFDDAADKTTGTDSGYGNGYFLQLSDGVVSIVERSSVTGNQVDTVISQSSWNIDTLDGAGNSGFTLDITKNVLFSVQIAWLGVGVVRLGFIVEGIFVVCHEFTHTANTTPYIQTAGLPVRWELSNISAGSLTYNFHAICASIIDEGQPPKFNYRRHGGNAEVTRRVNSSDLPIVSIRVNTSNPRRSIRPINISTIVDTNDQLQWELRRNTTLTGASWNSVTNSFAEIDVSATGVSGGIPVAGGYFKQELFISLNPSTILPASSQIDGTPIIYSLICNNSLGQGSSNVAGNIDWIEE